MNQREVYKIVKSLTTGAYADELALLRDVVRSVVDYEDLLVNGARVWRLHDSEPCYVLVHQYGAVQPIPDGYTVQIDQQPVFADLVAHHTVLNSETDSVLQEAGIRWYSATGVGEAVKSGNGRYFRYALAFSAPGQDENVFDTINIIGSVVTLRLKELKADSRKEALERDLAMARDIQRGLVPDHELTFRDYHIFGMSVAQNLVGGDFFDYLDPDEDGGERCGVVISDAASKGLPAATQALFVSGAMRMGIGFQSRIAPLMMRLNKLIYQTFPQERFVTLAYCELTDSANGLVHYVNAGHCAPLHFQAASREVIGLQPTGGILGIVPDQKFSVENINMAPGDYLVLFSDGIAEALNTAGNQFGEQRLRELIVKHAGADSRELAYRIFDDVMGFTEGAEYQDDKTLVVIRRLTESPAAEKDK